MNPGKRIILVRHTETEWQNVKDPDSTKSGQRLLGRTDISLSSQGLLRARRLGELLQGEGISEIFSSPLLRAQMATAAICESIQSPVNYVDALREIDFGLCEGLTFEEVEALFPEVHRSYLQQGRDVEFPQGETFEGFRIRIVGWLREMLSSSSGGTKLIVTHGGGVRTALCELLGWPPEMFWRIRQDYGSINIIGVYGDNRVIERINGKVVMQDE